MKYLSYNFKKLKQAKRKCINKVEIKLVENGYTLEKK